MPLSTGYVLNNRYRIVSLLGQGGFGAVYRAWDINLSRPCAVKENLGTSPEEQRQFNQEASLLANISHPNLPRVTDYFSIPDQGQYLVMDYVEGQDLNEKLNERGAPLPEDEVIYWIGQICDALDYLHMQDPPIIHRDVKPSNIKITPSGRAMLVDFGIAKTFIPNSKTAAGARAVTPGYSPVEQYGQGTTDARTDIYALGATLYALLTSQVPPESIQRRKGAQFLPPRAINQAISERTERAILKAMQVSPEARFESAADFKDALVAFTPYQATARAPVPSVDSFEGGRASVVMPISPPQAVRSSAVEPAAAPPPRKPWIWIGAFGLFGAILLFSLCALGVYLLLRTPTDDSATATLLSTNTVVADLEITDTPESIPPTETPTLESTMPTTEIVEPTLPPALGNPDASAPGETFFTTDFDDAENWYPISIPETEDFEFYADNGFLYIQVNPVKTTVYAYYDLMLTNPDVRLEASTETVAGPNTNNISVVCRATDKGWYEFSMTSGGYWYIWIYQSGEGFEQLAQGASNAINLKKASNQISATCIGPELTFYVNGTRMGSVRDDTFSEGGQVGVSVSTFDLPGAGVEFDFFSATVP